MKFDVVIGNPPYQNGKNKIFYLSFIKAAYNLGDTILFICPFAWIKSNKPIFKTMYNNGYFNLIEQKDANKEFKISMGTPLSVFLYNKKSINRGYSPIIELSKYAKNTYAENILNKILINSISPKSGKGQNKTNKNLNGFVSEKNNLHSYEVYLSSKIDRRSMWSIEPSPGYGIDKLICAHILDPKKPKYFLEYNKNKGVGRYAVYFECNKKEATNITKFFESKLYCFIDKIKRRGRYAFLDIPNIDWNNYESDKQIYKHFNLTQEEIDYIESTVK